MAGTRKNTSGSQKFRPQSDQVVKIRYYRQHLLTYAQQKKATFSSPAQTITVRQLSGTIFSQEKLLSWKIAQQLKLKPSFARHAGLRRFWPALADGWGWIIGLAHQYQRFVDVTYAISISPYVKISRGIARWNRKQSWSFRRTISAPTEDFSTQTSTSLKSFFAALGRPFYYTVKLFPFHTALALFLSAAILIFTWFTNELIFVGLPDPQALSLTTPPLTTRIMDRNGEVLFRLYEEENRTIVPLSKISPYLIKATVAIEDQDFYSHHGISISGIFRALLSNSQGLTTQGGSTITQQLVKNRLLTTEQTLRRKIREAILAVLAEGIYNKNQILEMYLNQVAYGGSTYGIEEAAHRYFSKTAAKLTLAESALIAGLPAAPSVYTPFGSNPELAKSRQLEVLRRMVEDGYISEAEAQAAADENLHYANDIIDIQAPHFVMYAKQLLAEKYGEDLLYRGGLEIKTTLDLKLQNDVQKKVTDEIDQLVRLRVSNGAALITNPRTGEIYAMVGSKNYFDFDHDGQVNVTLRPRQPGSSIKPLTYALALERGSTVTSIIQDQPITFNIPGSKPYSPQNYDGKFHGNVTLKEALASSYNIPAVKTLQQIGVNTMIDKAEEVGISTWNDRHRFGLSLTLGGGEVLMVEMAKLYGAFANDGYVTDLNPILEIKDHQGTVLYQNTCAMEGLGCSRKKVFDSRIAFLISNILSDNAARTPAFGPLSTLFIPNQQVAVKTGTTNNLRDNWTFGYTSDRFVGVWVGNNDNQSMSYVASGVTGASSIWNKVMTTLLDENNPHIFKVPAGLVKVASCLSSDNPTCPGCRSSKEEYYIVGTQPKQTCRVAQAKQPTSTP
ncbi:MAG: penicillin-binding protein [Candidatus Pacebacteria bacterium CG_4_10_14_0_8_um_filter_43_12]|nr:MAG: penicillin-binding protein [Candidatus Pacebacteria bacterium CG10_big_fil_rev_8_21_14_0_10_44_11]PIY79299.1 MAG: penicillin-binding protein [Candidatus Pacebacteria bacterium CG_4_10_14_0_8_um_filter_43_12]